VNTYSVRDAARILKLSPERLRYWERTGLVAPARADDGRALYGFRDLVCVKTMLLLLENGVPLRRIRRSVEAIRERVPALDRPLEALRVWLDGSDRVVLRHEGVLFEPSGQLVLDFRLAPPSPEDVAPLPVRRPDEVAPDPVTALEWFERGCRLDSEPGSEAAAREAYARAIEADPGFADAHCNLGTLHHQGGRREEARACYERALRCDAEHLEANFNLGCLHEEDGQDEAALARYRAAARADPLHAEAQLNLALLYDRLGLARRAREHWRRYLQLEPHGGWAEIARKHLEPE
jgi:tetratricopeptide (TPR) repeat protein